MCKIASILGVNDSNRAQVIKLIKALKRPMSKNDNDGFGVALVNAQGEYLVERWLNNAQAFKQRDVFSDAEQALFESLPNALEAEQTYSRDGNLAVWHNFTTIMLHARMATCGKCIENTHPFVKGNTILIHNGVVQGASKDCYNEMSTCDSEILLNLYADSCGDVNKVIQDVTGYQACMVFDRDTSGNSRLNVWRDDRAQLYAARLSQGLTLFCTSAEIIKYSVKHTKVLKLQALFKVKDYRLMRFDSTSGVCLESTSLKARPTYPVSRTYESYSEYVQENERYSELTSDDAPTVVSFDRLKFGGSKHGY